MISPLLVKLRKQLPQDYVYIEGTIFGPPQPHRDEPRDFGTLEAIMKLLFWLVIFFDTVMGVLYLVLPLIFQVAVVMLMFIVIFSIFIGHSRGSWLEWLVRLCVMPLKITLNISRYIFLQVAGIFKPATDPNNAREVREYTIDSPHNCINTFWVKGNIAPQNPKKGDEVRIWVKRRSDGRYFFQKGELTDGTTGDCKRLQISEPPLGIYWLVSFLALLSTSLAAFYFFLHV
jgi:uncharacterized membrane protein YphA (DoxX/SURF4 family)